MTEPLRFQFQAMASICEIAIAGVTRHEASQAAAAAEAEVRRIEQKYSRFRPESVLSRINTAAYAGPVALDPETASLLDLADHLHRLSGGLFDITTGLLQQAWDFVNGRIPSEGELSRALAHVGWHHVQRIDDAIRFDDPALRIDFGGFGKEYATDRAADVLRSAGVTSGYVNLGGDLRSIGPKPDGSPWRFGIRHPRKEGVLIASIPVSSGALATSGDYERYFEQDGRRYCHVLSPHSGMPVSHWQSVSVVAPLAVSAGAATTIAMLKERAGLEFLRDSGFAFLAIDHEGRTYTHKASD